MSGSHRFHLATCEAQQMVNAVFIALDVTIEHSGVRFEPDLVSRTCSLQPLVTVNLVIANYMPNAVIEYFRPATGQPINPASL